MTPGSDGRPTGVDPDSLVAVGVIRRSHGVRGEASVEILTASISRFEELERVFLVDPSRERVVLSAIRGVRAHQTRALLLLDGISSPEDVSLHRDWTIEIPESEARPLDDDEVFLHDLAGLEVLGREGQRIGRVIEILEGVAQVLLRVETDDGRRFEVPFVKAICPEVDLEAGRMIVELPDGLVELNTRGTS